MRLQNPAPSLLAQAEDLAKRSQDLQRQLDAKSQQLERQCLNAAESGAR